VPRTRQRPSDSGPMRQDERVERLRELRARQDQLHSQVAADRQFSDEERQEFQDNAAEIKEHGCGGAAGGAERPAG
jgi:hypothetical protein